MKRILIFLLIALPFASSKAQISKIEHFNVHSTKAAILYDFFKTTFKLPVVYDYQSYSNFSSGGLWLGNITLEFVDYDNNPYSKAIFKGVALEPVKTTDSIVAQLDKNDISHTAPIPTKFKVNGEEKTFWTNTVLKDVTSADVRVFVCDYTDRAFVNTPKAHANDSLTAINGGSLGIIGLKTLVFGVSDIQKACSVWSKIPGITTLEPTIFHLTEGPDALLQSTEKDGIIEVQLRVKSIDAAKDFLNKNQLLKKEGNTVLIDPERINGLRIILVDN